MPSGFETFDTIVVGARCAGAPLATHLARAGQRVVLLDAEKMPSDQPFSTHFVQPKGMAYLDALGCGDRIRAVAPAIRTSRLSVNGHHLDVHLPEAGAGHVPRRRTLDPILQEVAVSAGAELRDEHAVLDLVRDGDRVVGVKVRHGGRTHELRARIVVGADGRNSTVARKVRAEEYLVDETPRGGYWTYWPTPRCWTEAPRYPFQSLIAIDGKTARFVFETDGGLLIMGVLTDTATVRGWKGDPRGALERELRCHAVMGPLVEGNTPVGRPVGLMKGPCFFRQAAGPGWALVGDAGLHKDPTPGLGITDALRDAEHLGRAILDGSPAALDVYWRRRDVESMPLYFNAADMGSLEFANPLNEVVLSRANRSPEVQGRMARVMKREIPPQEMVPPATLLRWVLGAVLRGRFGVLGPLRDGARRAKVLAAELELRRGLLAAAEARFAAR